MAKESRAQSAMGGKKSKPSKKKSGRKVREIRIRRAKSGGYVIHHDLEPQPQSDAAAAMTNPADNQEEHVAPNMQSLQQHIAENLPEQDDDEEEGSGGQMQGAGGQ